VTEPVLHERTAACIEIIRLNRPDKRNALDTESLELLIGLLERAAADDEVRAVVLSSTTEKALCAGADVGERLDHAGGVARMAAFTHLYSLIDDYPVATVAVCVGNTIGAGAEIAAGCDLRVGGDNLKLAWVGAQLGVPVGPARLVPLIGVSRAKELVLTGRVVGAAEAEAIGFLHGVAPAAEAEHAAIELAGTVAGQSTDGIRTLKQMFRDLEDTTRRVAYENQRLMDFQQHGSGLPRGT
jgi:enoyl-CoA hydratase/carnithine racemase